MTTIQHPKLVEGGPSPAGWSLASPGRRCLKLWALKREEPTLVDDEDPELAYGSGLTPATHAPLARGIIAHAALAQLYAARLYPEQTWATWLYATGYHVSEACGRFGEDAHKAGRFVDAGGIDALQGLIDRHWPQGKLMPAQLGRWVRERWALAADRPEVAGVEAGIALWLDPASTKPYGVVHEPTDADARTAAYKRLRTSDWRQALRDLHEAGPPYLFTTRIDALTVERSLLTGKPTHWITDFKTGMRIDQRKHQGYQHSGQIIGLDLYGRTHYDTFGGVVLDYLPWLGKPWVRQASVAQAHRETFASTVADHWQRLCSFRDAPTARWPAALDEQVCRTIYTNPCDYYDRCREV